MERRELLRARRDALLDARPQAVELLRELLGLLLAVVAAVGEEARRLEHDLVELDQLVGLRDRVVLERLDLLGALDAEDRRELLALRER